MRAQTCRELIEGERLDQDIACSGLEGDQSVPHFGTIAEDDHGQRQSALANNRDGIEALVVTGQIEQDEPDILIERLTLPLENIMGVDDFETGAVEKMPKRLDVGRVASDHQDVLIH